jgi:hypothetical protein
MPPKKESKQNAEVIDGEDPVVFLLNYQKFSKTIGLTAHPGVPFLQLSQELGL